MTINPILRLKKDIFLQSSFKFNDLVSEIFQYQRNNCEVYRRWCDLYSPDSQHPVFLPIAFFKTHAIGDSKDFANTSYFSSSGTGNQTTSRHYVPDMEIYRSSFSQAFNLFYGNPADYCILALLPGYLERSGSSLIYMVNELIASARPGSGFYLNEYPNLKQQITLNEQAGIPTLLIGVTFALLEFSDYFKQHSGIALKHTLIMETGGMKGRGKELVRSDLHTLLSANFGTSVIHSEYGMTELLSQAYSNGNGKFTCPPWMSISIQDPTDPGTYFGHGKTGRICVTDLANLHSCSFIATDDLGKTSDDGSFEVLGRLDFSDIRGCNLMIT